MVSKSGSAAPVHPLTATGWESGERDTLIGALGRMLEAHPHKTFLRFSEGEWTYASFYRDAVSLAHGLMARGVGPGDLVASLIENKPQAVLTWFAANLVGAAYSPINTSYVGEFLRHQLHDSQARVIVCDSRLADSLQSVCDELPLLKYVAVVGAGPLPRVGDKVVERLEKYAAEPHKGLSYTPTPSDISCVLYTSGTSGRSKGCSLSHNFLCHTGRQFNWFSGRTAADANWTALPLFHLNAAAGSVVATLLLGSTVTIAERFSVSSFWEEILESKASVIYLVGPMMPLIARAAESPQMKAAYGQLRAVVSAPSPAEFVKIFKERFGIRHVGGSGFGQTEVSMPFMVPVHEEGKAGTNGRLLPFFEAQIVDEDDAPLPPGAVGEVILRPTRPDIIFAGYWKHPEETAQAFRNLWYHTGDLGRFDEEGYFYFVDRKKDYLRRGGENISSSEMEVVLGHHPDIAELAVHAVPSELAEDEVKVTAVLKPGAALSHVEFYQWSTQKVPRFAVPRYIEFRAALPRNPIGRVLKFKLRDEGVTATTWDRKSAGLDLPKRAGRDVR